MIFFTYAGKFLKLGELGDAVESEVEGLEVLHVAEVTQRPEPVLLHAQFPEVGEAREAVRKMRSDEGEMREDEGR